MNNINKILKSSSQINLIIQSINTISNETLYLTGGTLRNIIWNYLHKFDEYYEIEDCDIIFYNSTNIDKEYEISIQEKLKAIEPKIDWSVKNQARMHIRNNHNQYKNIEDALFAFPETCSAIAIDRNYNLIAPYGVIDILNFQIVPTKFCVENEYHIFFKRIDNKKWINKWNKLRIRDNHKRHTTKYINHWAISV